MARSAVARRTVRGSRIPWMREKPKDNERSDFYFILGEAPEANRLRLVLIGDALTVFDVVTAGW